MLTDYDCPDWLYTRLEKIMSHEAIEVMYEAVEEMQMHNNRSLVQCVATALGGESTHREDGSILWKFPKTDHPLDACIPNGVIVDKKPEQEDTSVLEPDQSMPYKEVFLVNAGYFGNPSIRVKKSPKDSHALHHGAFASVQEAKDWVNRKPEPEQPVFTQCACTGCTNEATHTWSGHPTCDECATPMRKEKKMDDKERIKRGDEIRKACKSITKDAVVTEFVKTKLKLEEFQALDPKAIAIQKMKELYLEFAKTREEMNQVIGELEDLVGENQEFGEALTEMERAIDKISQYL